MDAADIAERNEEIAVAHMQGRRARSNGNPPTSCTLDEDHLVTAWQRGYEERAEELATHPDDT